jgi:hypothetical protein
MALVDDIKTRFPDLECEVDIDKYYAALSFSNAEFWMCWFCFEYVAGDCNAEKILNLVAHLLVVEGDPSSASQKDVSSQSVGSVSESYVDHDGTISGEYKEFFSTTKYGQRYLTLLASGAGGGFFV